MARSIQEIADDVVSLNDTEVKKLNAVCSSTSVWDVQSGANQTIQDLAVEIDGLSDTDLNSLADSINTGSVATRKSRRPC